MGRRRFYIGIEKIGAILLEAERFALSIPSSPFDTMERGIFVFMFVHVLCAS